MYAKLVSIYPGRCHEFIKSGVYTELPLAETSGESRLLQALLPHPFCGTDIF